MSSIGMQRFILIFIRAGRATIVLTLRQGENFCDAEKYEKRVVITPVEWNSHSISYKVIKRFDIFSLKEEVLSHSVVYCRMLSAFLKIDLSFSNKLFNTV